MAFPHANQSLTEVHVRLPFLKSSRRKGLSAEFRLCITLLIEAFVSRYNYAISLNLVSSTVDPEVADAEHISVRGFDKVHLPNLI